MTDWERFTFEESPDVRVGISSCLLGEMVRYNGGHAHDSFVTTTLGPYVTWVPICPEVDLGMGTPRETIRLERSEDGIILRAPDSGTDYTEKMHSYAVSRTEQLAGENIHGYILKKNSPSCGMERVKVFDKNGVPHREGRGLFAEQLISRFPLLPVEEEGRLRDTTLRENFIERLFAHYRLQGLLSQDPSAGDMVSFHTRHKLTLMSHHQERYRELGRLVAQAGTMEKNDFLGQYAYEFMKTLEVHANRKNHTNVLHHIIGFFKDELDSEDKAELVETIDRYRNNLIPLIVPLTLINHHLRRHPVDWLLSQVYLHPYPQELRLRNST